MKEMTVGSVRRTCGAVGLLALLLGLILAGGVVLVYELTSLIDAAEGAVTGALLNPESMTPARGVTAMLGRYDDPGLPAGAFAALEKGASTRLGAPERARAEELFAGWRAKTEVTLIGSRFDEDWAETPPLPVTETETPALERMGQAVDRTRLANLRLALGLLYRALRVEGRTEAAARLLLSRLAFERQILAHEATVGPGILPATRRLFVRSLAAAATELCDLGRRGGLPPALLGTALTRLETCDRSLPLAGRVFRGFPLLVRQVAARHPSFFLDAEAIDLGLRLRLPPVGTDGEPLRGRYAELKRLSREEPYVRPTLFDRLLSSRQTLTRAILASAATDVGFAEAVREEITAQARLRGAALLWEATAVRSATGHWPHRLADLGPHVSERMRRDPFTGDELRLRVNDDTDTIFIWTPALHGSTTAPIPVPDCVVLVPPPGMEPFREGP